MNLTNLLSDFGGMVAPAFSTTFNSFNIEFVQLLSLQSIGGMIVLLGGFRLFAIVAFGLRGALAVVLAIFALLTQAEDRPPWVWSLMLAALWGLAPYLLATALESVLRLNKNLEFLRQKHLILFAMVDSVAIFALLVLLLLLAEVEMPSALAISAVGGATNLLGTVLLMAFAHVFIKLFRRVS